MLQNSFRQKVSHRPATALKITWGVRRCNPLLLLLRKIRISSSLFHTIKLPSGTFAHCYPSLSPLSALALGAEPFTQRQLVGGHRALLLRHRAKDSSPPGACCCCTHPGSKLLATGRPYNACKSRQIYLPSTGRRPFTASREEG